MIKKYSDNWYENIKAISLQSARELVPYILELVKPKNVIDIGCGLGVWLYVFQEYGVSDIMGIDGDWVNKNNLLIQKNQFFSWDLTNPIELDNKFDLVVSLEVGEHLPENSAEIFVESLIKLGNVIFFSAAIPLQGGTNHMNEQWQEYWVKLFRDRDYLVVDCIRERFWNNKKISFHYRQNCFIFVKRDYLKTNELLMEEYKNSNKLILSIVHPEKYLSMLFLYRNELMRIMRKYKNYEMIFSLIKKLPIPTRTIRFLLSKFQNIG